MSDDIPRSRGPLGVEAPPDRDDDEEDPGAVPNILTESDLVRIADDRKQLSANGYAPVALLAYNDPDPKKAGKAPHKKCWVTDARKNPPEDARHSKALAFAPNTGIACHNARAIDIDCGDWAKVADIKAIAFNVFGETIVRYRPNSSRCALLYRPAEGEPRKRVLRGTTHSDDPVHPDKVEVLGSGFQLAAFGIHRSGVPIEWTRSPLVVPREMLTAVTEAQVTEFFTKIAPIIGAQAPESVRERQKARQPAPDLPAELARASGVLMALVPSDDYDQWIEIGAALYHETGGDAAGLEVWTDWSAKSEKFNAAEIPGVWDSFERSDGPQACFGKIYHIAAQYGWKPKRDEDDPGYLTSLEAEARARYGPRNGPDHPELHTVPEPSGDPTPVLRLRYGFEATYAEPLGTVVEGLLYAGSVTLAYGPPKSGKSFLLTDLALAVAAEEAEWMGHIIVRPGPVLYVACEGHGGFWKRTTAAAIEHGWSEATFPKGFILATGRPRLIRVDARGMHFAPDPSAIFEALADANRRGLEPVAIMIDTVFRSFGEGNVNASPDMNVYLAAIAALTDRSYAAALVHHEIKSGGTPAGSVSLIGGADTIVHVWREGENDTERRLWQIEMAKDDAETEPRGFTLKTVNVGLDPDGRWASSCVVKDAGAAPEAKKKRGRPSSDTSDAAVLSRLIYNELCNLLASDREGLTVTIHPGAPPIRAVSRSLLRTTVNQAGILVAEGDAADRKATAKSNDKRFERAINRLKDQKKIASDQHWIGLVS